MKWTAHTRTVNMLCTPPGAHWISRLLLNIIFFNQFHPYISEPFSKDIDEIINDLRKVEIATGKDISTIKEDLEEGKGSPTAGGSFGGNGASEAEQEATEVGGENAENFKEEETNADGNDGGGDGGEGMLNCIFAVSFCLIRKC